MLIVAPLRVDIKIPLVPDVGRCLWRVRIKPLQWCDKLYDLSCFCARYSYWFVNVSSTVELCLNCCLRCVIKNWFSASRVVYHFADISYCEWNAPLDISLAPCRFTNSNLGIVFCSLKALGDVGYALTYVSEPRISYMFMCQNLKAMESHIADVLKCLLAINKGLRMLSHPARLQVAYGCIEGIVVNPDGPYYSHRMQLCLRAGIAAYSLSPMVAQSPCAYAIANPSLRVTWFCSVLLHYIIQLAGWCN